jgi:hypothetical protein
VLLVSKKCSEILLSENDLAYPHVQDHGVVNGLMLLMKEEEDYNVIKCTVSRDEISKAVMTLSSSNGDGSSQGAPSSGIRYWGRHGCRDILVGMSESDGEQEQHGKDWSG